MKRDENIISYEGRFACHPKDEIPDIIIDIDTTLYPNVNQIIDITTWSGQNKRTKKVVSLSLAQVIELRNKLQEVIDYSPMLINSK